MARITAQQAYAKQYAHVAHIIKSVKNADEKAVLNNVTKFLLEMFKSHTMTNDESSAIIDNIIDNYLDDDVANDEIKLPPLDEVEG